VYTRSEQEKEEEKGVPTVVAKNNKTKKIMARAVPGEELDSYTVETVKKMVERLGHKKIIVRGDVETAILALKESVRRGSDVEIALEEAPAGERDQERAGPVSHDQGRPRAGAGDEFTENVKLLLRR
jgi:hypothetical protein